MIVKYASNVQYIADLVVCLSDKTWVDARIEFWAEPFLSVGAAENRAVRLYANQNPNCPYSHIFVKEISTEA